MARTERNNVDYFPFLCKEGKVLFSIESKYGNDGFAVWVKILRELAVTNYHHIDLSEEIDLDYLASKCRVNGERLIEIINDLAKYGEFDRALWDDCKIVWCQKFIDNIQDAYRKRTSKCISKSELLERLSVSTGRNVITTAGLPAESQLPAEEKRIEENIIKKDTIYLSDGTKIENLFDWINKEFSLQTDNWKRLYPGVALQRVCEVVTLERAGDELTDKQHVKNVIHRKWKELNKENPKQEGFRPRPVGQKRNGSRK